MREGGTRAKSGGRTKAEALWQTATATVVLQDSLDCFYPDRQKMAEPTEPHTAYQGWRSAIVECHTKSRLHKFHSRRSAASKALSFLFVLIAYCCVFLAWLAGYVRHTCCVTPHHYPGIGAHSTPHRSRFQYIISLISSSSVDSIKSFSFISTITQPNVANSRQTSPNWMTALSALSLAPRHSVKCH